MKETTMRIGVDTGGTFTDVAGLADGELRTWKLPSTPGAYERAVLEGAAEVAAGGEARLMHSTTVATNALLEGKGARTALVTTRGFRDVLEIARQDRPFLYDPTPRKTPPLIPRELRFELTERVGADGAVRVPLDPEELEALPDRLRAAGAESVAVVFLFSFLYPGHERRVGGALRRAGFPVSLSHEILPEFREYERTSTTAVNAYVRPAMERYLSRLETGAAARRLSRPRIVQSDGGALPPARAGAEAVHTLLSGPAAGLRGAILTGEAGEPGGGRNLITFDMGGTSTDVSLIGEGPRLSTGMTLGGFPVGVPMVDVHTVGAGGGSIASVDAGGALRVGPESAGADPGPACYGRGERATVTDAHVVLGNLRTESFLRGRMTLHADRARAALERLGRDMGGLSAEDAARGVIRLVNTHMENAVRVISVQRGYAPEDFTLVGFGGAGGLHVFALAEALNMRRVRVPVHPGVLSALGAAAGELSQEVSRTVMRAWSVKNLTALRDDLAALTEDLRARFLADGFETEDLAFSARLDMRYLGQAHELSVSVPVEDPSGAADAFHAAHRRRYGHAETSAPVELVTVRARASLPPPPLTLPDRPERGPEDPPAETAPGVFRRERLRRGEPVAGPALVLEDFHTVVVPEGWRLRPDRVGNLLGEPEEPA